MDIGVPVKELGDIEVTPLIDAIMSIDDEAWLANNHRQNAYEVHAQTQSLVMLFVDLVLKISVFRHNFFFFLCPRDFLFE